MLTRQKRFGYPSRFFVCMMPSNGFNASFDGGMQVMLEGFLSNKNEMQRTVSHRYPGLSVPENGCKTGAGLKYKKKEDKRKKGLHLITVIISQHLQIVK